MIYSADEINNEINKKTRKFVWWSFDIQNYFIIFAMHVQAFLRLWIFKTMNCGVSSSTFVAFHHKLLWCFIWRFGGKSYNVFSYFRVFRCWKMMLRSRKFVKYFIRLMPLKRHMKMCNLEKINRYTGSKQEVFDAENSSFTKKISTFLAVEASFWWPICMG